MHSGSATAGATRACCKPLEERKLAGPPIEVVRAHETGYGSVCLFV